MKGHHKKAPGLPALFRLTIISIQILAGRMLGVFLKFSILCLTTIRCITWFGTSLSYAPFTEFIQFLTGFLIKVFRLVHFLSHHVKISDLQSSIGISRSLENRP